MHLCVFGCLMEEEHIVELNVRSKKIPKKSRTTKAQAKGQKKEAKPKAKE